MLMNAVNEDEECDDDNLQKMANNDVEEEEEEEKDAIIVKYQEESSGKNNRNGGGDTSSAVVNHKNGTTTTTNNNNKKQNLQLTKIELFSQAMMFLVTGYVVVEICKWDQNIRNRMRIHWVRLIEYLFGLQTLQLLDPKVLCIY